MEQAAPSEQEARAHFRLAQLQHQRGRFLEAAAEFEAAFALSERPELLYNIFLAYRDAGEVESAMRALRRLLEVDLLPQTLRREQLRARLEALEELLAERHRLETGEDEDGLWAPGFVVMGAGTALIVAGAITGGRAHPLYRDIGDRCTDGICPASTEGDRSTGKALTITTDVLIPAGVVMAVTGLFLAFLINERGHDLALLVGPRGASLALYGRF